ncbi:MAG: FMN-binding protein [Proteobacteria bacterium]|nr:FMN-binding protein [Pseudomonadota bacterium]MBU1610744.1 FMN-binding protein [Pseudomonadota bacterium]
MREILKMVCILSLICGLSGLTLSFLKEVTTERIEEQKLVFVQGPALAQVFDKADNDPVKDRKKFTLPSGEDVVVFPAMEQGKLTGVAIETFGRGYGGDLGIMVGLDLVNDKLAGIGTTTLKETPGIGSKVAKHGFTAQFKGHALDGLALTSTGGDIEAVSGASVSSGAAMEAIGKALTIYESLKDQFATTWPSS